MMRWFACSALLVLSACDVASVLEAPDTIARNECTSNADCGPGVCIDNQCRSKTSTLDSVLFEVTPPADGSAIAGVQFLVDKDLSQGQGSLVLEQISQVSGKVTAAKWPCEAYFGTPGSTLLRAMDDSLPATISLIPASSALGLYSPRAKVQSRVVDSIYWGFSANVAPGTYDIYVEPGPQPDQSCPVPPQLLRGQKIESGTLPVEIQLRPPSAFEFHVTWSREDGALDGWQVDMLDPVSGRVISNRIPLTLAKKSTTDYVATLAYSSVLLDGKTSEQPQDQLLRLSPPEGLPEDTPLPTLLLARSGIALFEPDRGTLTDFTTLPSAVLVHGQVTAGNTPTPAAATVTLVATELTGIQAGVLASFVRTVSVGADGRFDVHLLPGKYHVTTVPQSSLEPGTKNEMPLAADTREWLVPSSPAEQAGKVIGLGSAVPVNGQVLDETGSPVATAQVQAVASPLSVRSNPLEEALGGAPLVPRASAGVVSSRGAFSFKTDPGTFDISVRPNSDTGFGWLVLPSVPVTSAVGVGLGSINMPFPVAYRFTVTVPGTEGENVVVPGALVRAYVYLKGGSDYVATAAEADSVLQVAETRADNSGNFQVLIPAELNRRE